MMENPIILLFFVWLISISYSSLFFLAPYLQSKLNKEASDNQSSLERKSAILIGLFLLFWPVTFFLSSKQFSECYKWWLARWKTTSEKWWKVPLLFISAPALVFLSIENAQCFFSFGILFGALGNVLLWYFFLTDLGLI